MRESMFVVIAVPFGCKGETTVEKAFTDNVVVAKVAALERTLVILTTLTEDRLPWATNHMGSPATESCMVAGRRIFPLMLLWKGVIGFPATRSLMATEVTWT